MTATARLHYLIGIDGGGSGTRARLTAADGGPLGQGSAGPSALGQGVAQAWRHVIAAAADAVAGWCDLPAEVGGDLLAAARRGYAGLAAAVVAARAAQVPVVVFEG